MGSGGAKKLRGTGLDLAGGGTEALSEEEKGEFIESADLDVICNISYVQLTNTSMLVVLQTRQPTYMR